jgi:hypothetical protein
LTSKRLWKRRRSTGLWAFHWTATNAPDIRQAAARAGRQVG